MPDVMAASLVLAIVLLLAANSDQIARVKASMSGIEAETRAVIDEARATIEQLRSIARLAVQANLSLLMRAGRLGGFTHSEKETTRAVSVEALKQLGIPSHEQEKMFEEWHTITRFDYSGHRVPDGLSAKPDVHAEWKALRRGGFANIPSSEVLEKFLSKAELLDAERAALLDDHRFYEREKQHRRPEV